MKRFIDKITDDEFFFKISGLVSFMLAVIIGLGLVVYGIMYLGKMLLWINDFILGDFLQYWLNVTYIVGNFQFGTVLFRKFSFKDRPKLKIILIPL